MIDHASQRRPLARLIAFLLEIPGILALLGLTVALVCYPTAARLQLDRSVTSMFDPADQTRLDYQELQDAFGGNAIAILVYSDDGLFSIEGLNRNQAISQQVLSIKGVKGILSPSKLNEAIEQLRPAGLLTGFSKKVPGLLRQTDEVARQIDRDFAGYTHSADRMRGGVVAMLDPGYRDATIGELKELTSQLPAQYPGAIIEAALVGEPVLVHDAFALIERDGARLATFTVGLLSLVLLVSLLDLRLVILTGVIIAWSVTVTRATMVCLGISLSLVSTILTSIVTVIAVATVLHLGVRFRVARSRGHTVRDSAFRSLHVLLLPILWTCATDAAGFAALTWSRILPVRDFGMMIAIAASAVLIATVLFAPAALMLPSLRFGRRIQQAQKRIARRLQKNCLRLAAYLVNRRVLAVVVSVIIAGLAVFGVTRTEVETSFLNNFRSNSPIVVDYEFVEDQFGGAGVWDIVLGAPANLEDAYMGRVRELETELREINVDGAALTKVLSLADADAAVSQVRILSLAQPEFRLAGMRATIPVFVDALMTPATLSGNRKFRIMLRSREHLPANQKTQLIAAVQKTVEQRVNSPAWQADGLSDSGFVTGYYVMMSRLVSQLVADQWRCFLASGILVWMLLLMATRSVRLATAALIPNLLPVLLILSLVGLLGGKINMGATMIAAVSVGLSIDGSVHFLAGYLRRRRRGHGHEVAAIHAAGNIGVPVLLATLALVCGFSVLVTSEFIPTATFGLLVAATLAAGTAINLTLLPAFVAWIDR